MRRRQTAKLQSRSWIVGCALALCLHSTAFAGDFECADPGDIDPGEADVVVTKQANVSEAGPGDEVTFTLQVHNCGPAAAVDVEFTDLLPLRVIVSSVTQLSGPTAELFLPQLDRKLIESDPEWSGTIDALPVGETAIFEIVVQVDYL